MVDFDRNTVVNAQRLSDEIAPNTSREHLKHDPLVGMIGEPFGDDEVSGDECDNRIWGDFERDRALGPLRNGGGKGEGVRGCSMSGIRLEI